MLIRNCGFCTIIDSPINLNLCLCCDDLHRSAASRLSFRIDFVFLCRDSAIQVHLMALAAPSIDDTKLANYLYIRKHLNLVKIFIST